MPGCSIVYRGQTPPSVALPTLHAPRAPAHARLRPCGTAFPLPPPPTDAWERDRGVASPAGRSSTAPAMDPAALQRARARFTIDLHPSKLAEVEEGVREHLNKLLLR